MTARLYRVSVISGPRSKGLGVAFEAVPLLRLLGLGLLLKRLGRLRGKAEFELVSRRHRMLTANHDYLAEDRLERGRRLSLQPGLLRDVTAQFGQLEAVQPGDERPNFEERGQAKDLAADQGHRVERVVTATGLRALDPGDETSDAP